VGEWAGAVSTFVDLFNNFKRTASCDRDRGVRSICCGPQPLTYADGNRDGERALGCSVERCASWLKSSEISDLEKQTAAESARRPQLLRWPL
jgi:hypothetical protein